MNGVVELPTQFKRMSLSCSGDVVWVFTLLLRVITERIGLLSGDERGPGGASGDVPALTGASGSNSKCSSGAGNGVVLFCFRDGVASCASLHWPERLQFKVFVGAGETLALVPGHRHGVVLFCFRERPDTSGDVPALTGASGSNSKFSSAPAKPWHLRPGTGNGVVLFWFRERWCLR